MNRTNDFNDLETYERIRRNRCTFTEILGQLLKRQDKVLFETDYPVIDFKRTVEELEELEFRETAKRRLLVENAVRVYHLED